MNREEIMHLLRLHVATLAGMLEHQNDVPKNVLLSGGGPENRGGLNRITELIAMLPDKPTRNYGDGE